MLNYDLILWNERKNHPGETEEQIKARADKYDRLQRQFYRVNGSAARKVDAQRRRTLPGNSQRVDLGPIVAANRNSRAGKAEGDGPRPNESNASSLPPNTTEQEK